MGHNMYLSNSYFSICELAKTAYSLVLTKLFNRPASLIRRPVYLRGKPWISIGKGFRTGYRCRIEAFGERGGELTRIHIGENCHIGDSVHISAVQEVRIGNNCLLASHIFISDSSHGSYHGENQDSPASPPEERDLVSAPTFIGDNVWIGEHVTVLMGARIGNGCIVGANSVVTKTFPDNCILVGSPAKIIKRFDEMSGTWRPE